MSIFGLDIRKLVTSLRELPIYLKNLIEFKRDKSEKEKNHENGFEVSRLYPCFGDRYDKSGGTGGHYFKQDLLVAKRIFEEDPKVHVDIGSRVDGFVSHVASFRKIKVLDIRPNSSSFDNIEFYEFDVMGEEKNTENFKCDSMSCLHTIEHFGLGRYGDDIDYMGHVKGLKRMYNILDEGGRFYISTPVGEQRVEFDAHRVFSISYLVELFEKMYEIDRMHLVDDEDILHRDITIKKGKEECSNIRYGCGIFELRKEA